MTQPNPTAQGPFPMVLQNLLQNQGMVATQPLVQQNTTTTYSIQHIYHGVHHLITLSSKANLQTRHNRYGSAMKIINPFIESTSTALDMSLHLPIPPIDATSKVPKFPLHRIVNNPAARPTLTISSMNSPNIPFPCLLWNS